MTVMPLPLSMALVAKICNINTKISLLILKLGINSHTPSNGLFFQKNLGKRLSIDETSLSNSELYTILTKKQPK
jgi:hypothetical protein